MGVRETWKFDLSNRTPIFAGVKFPARISVSVGQALRSLNTFFNTVQPTKLSNARHDCRRQSWRRSYGEDLKKMVDFVQASRLQIFTAWPKRYECSRRSWYMYGVFIVYYYFFFGWERGWVGSGSIPCCLFLFTDSGITVIRVCYQDHLTCNLIKTWATGHHRCRN